MDSEFTHAPKVINLGSLCIDYVYTVAEIAEQGVTIASTDRQIFAGGKGLNQSIAAAQAGVQVVHVGAIGEDGNLLRETLSLNNIDDAQVVTLPGASGHAFIQVNERGENAIVIYGGCNRMISSEMVTACLNGATVDDVLLLQNEINDIDQIIKQAASSGIRVILNLAPADGRIKNYTIELLHTLIVNEQECLALARSLGLADDTTLDAYHALLQTYPTVAILLTRGKKGLLYKTPNTQEHLELSAFVVEAVDETAAGDAFVGYFVASVLQNVKPVDALQRASAAGALAVTKAGAAPSIPSSIQVNALLTEQQLNLETKTLILSR